MGPSTFTYDQKTTQRRSIGRKQQAAEGNLGAGGLRLPGRGCPALRRDVAPSCAERNVRHCNHADDGANGRYWHDQIVPHLGKDGIEYVGPVDDRQKNDLLGKAAATLVPVQWGELV